MTGPGSGDWKMRITHDAMALTGTGASESSTAWGSSCSTVMAVSPMTASTSSLVSGPVGLATGGGSIMTTEGSGFAAMVGKDVGSITGVATGQVAAPEEQAAAIRVAARAASAKVEGQCAGINAPF